MSKGVFTPIESYNIDTRSPKDKWVDDVNEKLFVNERKPQNGMMTIPQILQFNSKINSVYAEGIPASFDQGGGFYGLGGGAIDARFFNYIYSPQSFGMNFVNNIKASFNLQFLQVDEIAPATPPTADSDYTVDFYIGLSRLFDTSIFPELIIANDPSSRLLNIKTTITYTLATDTFTMDTYPLTLNLNDTLLSRPTVNISGQDYADFSENRDKITKEQYEYITNNSFPIYCTAGYDWNQWQALTGNNFDHFEWYFVDITGGTDPLGQRNGAWQVFWSLNLTYFGLTANYKPKS